MTTGSEIKKCPACGKQFECYSDSDCWCEQVHINRKEYAEIVARYNDCLCPDCLKQYAEE